MTPYEVGVKLAYLLAHVDGASGSGKTTTLKMLQAAQPGIQAIDTDIFRHEAKGRVRKEHPNASLEEQPVLRDQFSRQALADYLKTHADKPVALFGVDEWKGDRTLDVPNEGEKLRLDTGPLKSSWRAYWRQFGKDDGLEGVRPKARSVLSMVDHYKNNRQHLDALDKGGFKPMSQQAIVDRIGELLRNKQVDPGDGSP